MRATLLALVVCAAILALLSLSPGEAAAIDRNFAGSAQLDYMFVPTQPGADAYAGTGNYAFDGFTLEATTKVAVDISDHLSANVKACFGCHGFELDMAYFDYRVVDELNVRFGRFSPSFGSFNLRHDTANHKLSDKPLPYDMGRMLRQRAWNYGVIPSPFPDNGIEVNGTHWFGQKASFDYAAYAIAGFRAGPNPDRHRLHALAFLGQQLLRRQQRAPDGRRGLSFTYKLGPLSDMTLGASGMYGTYDADNKLAYLILGGDVVFRFNRTNVRAEYLVRRTDMDVSDPARFAYTVPATGGNFFVKHGAYVEVEQPLSRNLNLIGRVDGLLRVGNFLADPSGQTPLSFHSGILRYTVGTSFALERGVRVKLSGELWKFTDTDASGHDTEVSAHAGLVATF